MPRTPRLPVVAAVLLALSLTAACSGLPGLPTLPTSPDRPSPFAGARYVALGDSFTSGPFVPTTRLAGGCLRSDGNYPALLARRLEVARLVDVSCAAARTRHLIHPQRVYRSVVVPPQLVAVDARADLVTVGVGGNDGGLYADLLSTCVRLADQDPTGAPCRQAVEARGLTARLARIGRNLERALTRVRELAPRARVVLVGYPRISPGAGGCPRRLPYARGDVAFGDEVARRLAVRMRAAADRAGVEFLDMYAASAGHDVCSRRPWVNGARTDRTRALGLHPLPAGMRAVARELERLLLR